MFDKRKVTAILLAAGSGTRFGAGRNKAYVEANGKPIARYSLDVLWNNAYVDEVILVIRDGEQELAERLMETAEGGNPENRKAPVRTVTGGATRQESVFLGLKKSVGDIVLIQDSARPMIRDSYVTRCVRAMADYPGAAMAVRSKDTIKLSDADGVVTATTVRANTWVVQTPQCFHRDVLLAAHEQYRDHPGITDDCMLLELAGEKVKLLEGDYTNIKVTTAEDLTLAEDFLSLKRS